MMQVMQHKMKMHVCILCLFIFGGACFYALMEEHEHEDGSTTPWTYVDGMYWAICTLTTVGYGDMSLTR
jgi:hypothetical protein